MFFAWDDIPMVCYTEGGAARLIPKCAAASLPAAFWGLCSGSFGGGYSSVPGSFALPAKLPFTSIDFAVYLLLSTEARDSAPAQQFC